MIAPLYLLVIAEPPASDVLDALRRAGYHPRPHFVTSPEEVGAALNEQAWDAILADAAFAETAWEALAWVERQRPDVPFFVLTPDADAGSVAWITAGATDVLGRGDVQRLGLAIAKAQRERGAHADFGAAGPDSAFHALAAHMPIGLYRTTEDGRILYANPALARILGRDSVAELLGTDALATIAYPREDFMRRMREEGEIQDHEVRWERPGGGVLVTCENTRAVHDSDGRLL
ncbi:MAG: PAS domain-containing protein, partial [Rhodothermales bacterium]|nr:PAS domain-containing protein [Rhodothermales bacterium]